VNNDERLLTSELNRGTYPRLVRLSDGPILSYFIRFPDGKRALYVARSLDNRRTVENYSEVTYVARDVDKMFLVEAARDVVFAVFRNHDLGQNGSIHFRITVCQSTGETEHGDLLPKPRRRNLLRGLGTIHGSGDMVKSNSLTGRNIHSTISTQCSSLRELPYLPP